MNAAQKKIAVARAAIAGLNLLGAPVPVDIRVQSRASGVALVAMTDPRITPGEVNREYPGTFAAAELEVLPEFLSSF